METFCPQNFPKFFCESCDIKTNNKKDFNKHLLTAKHQKLTLFPQIQKKFPKTIHQS
jgi:hypothetical protein